MWRSAPSWSVSDGVMWMPESCRVDPHHRRFRFGCGQSEQRVDHRPHSLVDPIDGCSGGTFGATEPVITQQRADVDRLAVGCGVGEGVDQIDQRLDREADLGVVPGCDVHDSERNLAGACKVLNLVSLLHETLSVP